MGENETETEQTEAPKSGLRKRTVLIWLAVIGIWILIAIPGSIEKVRGDAAAETIHRHHGWPLVHLQTTDIDVVGVWVRGQFIPGRKPEPEKISKMLNDFEAEHSYEYNGVMLNLMPHGKEADPDWTIDKFWADIQSWPKWEEPPATRKYSLQTIGIVGNAITLLLILAGVGYLAQKTAG